MTTPLRPGDPDRLGEYALTGRLGEGGQGVVYAGRSAGGGEVAVKLLRAQIAADPKARERFLRELQVAEQVAGFCTARVLDADTAGDQPYIVGEFVPGPSLQELIQHGGIRDGTALERLAIGTATALAAIHQAGIVHRDFKPPNVLMAPDGPRVIDFGIARALQSDATMTSQVIGTPAYMAPEQISGAPIGPAADMFAWGATILYAATGQSPFTADTVPAVMHRVLYGDIDVSMLPGRLAGLVAACMSKNPAARPSAPQVLVALLGLDGAGSPIIGADSVLAAGATAAVTGQLPTQAGPAVPFAPPPPPYQGPPAPFPGAPFQQFAPNPSPTAKGIPILALIGVLLGVLAADLAGNAPAVNAPMIMADLHPSFATFNWMLQTFDITLLLALLPMGRLADLIGRKLVFTIGSGLLLLGTLATTGVTSTALFFPIRFVAGLGAAAVLSAGLGILYDAFGQRRLIWALGAWGAALAVSIGAGQLIGAEVVDVSSWRWSFLLPVPFGLIALVLVLVGARESRRRPTAPRPFDVLTVGLFSVGLLALAVGMANGEGSGWTKPLTLATLALGVPLTAAAAVISGLVRPTLVAGRGWAATGAITLGSVTGYGALAYFSFQLQEVQHASLLRAGAWLLPVGFGCLLAAIGAAALAHRFGPRLPLSAGAAACGLAAFGFVAVSGRGNAVILPFSIILGLGLGLLLVGGASATVAAPQDQLAGFTGGLQYAGNRLGAFVGTVVLGSLASHRASSYLFSRSTPATVHQFQSEFADSWHLSLIIAGVIALVGAGLAWLARPALAPVDLPQFPQPPGPPPQAFPQQPPIGFRGTIPGPMRPPTR